MDLICHSAAVAVRLAISEDTDELNQVQHACFPQSFHEDPAVFKTMVQHNMSLVVQSEAGLLGYGLVHSIQDPESPPCLNTIEDAAQCSNQTSAVPHYDGHVFIHDVSIHVSCAGFQFQSHIRILGSQPTCHPRTQHHPNTTL